eukprot:1021941-Pelagomonas_calceolata.AAC.10
MSDAHLNEKSSWLSTFELKTFPMVMLGMRRCICFGRGALGAVHWLAALPQNEVHGPHAGKWQR